MSEPIKIWGIAVLAPAQKPAVDAHCFGDCGKISMAGAINDDLTAGGLYVCCERWESWDNGEVEGKMQDPNGVNAWLEQIDAAIAARGEAK